MNDEDIEAKCSDCNNQKFRKVTKIIAEPSTLIIQLKRYKYKGEERKSEKKNDIVKLSKNIRLADGSSYTIASVLNHFGDSPDEGHYNILVYDESNDSFTLVDDQYFKLNVKITPDYETSSYIFVFNKDH